jgi:hypothetical protein
MFIYPPKGFRKITRVLFLFLLEEQWQTMRLDPCCANGGI